MEEIKNKLFLSIKHFLQRRPISLAPNPQSSPFSSASDSETPVAADDQLHQQLEPADVPNPFGVVPAHDVEWSAKVIGFCLSWAAAIALISLQIHVPLPISFHFPSHATVIALTLLFISKFMYPKSPERAQVLEHMGVLFGVTAFFFAITIPFPLYVKLIYWTIFALSLLAIFLCKRLNHVL